MDPFASTAPHDRRTAPLGARKGFLVVLSTDLIRTLHCTVRPRIELYLFTLFGDRFPLYSIHVDPLFGHHTQRQHRLSERYSLRTTQSIRNGYAWLEPLLFASPNPHALPFHRLHVLPGSFAAGDNLLSIVARHPTHCFPEKGCVHPSWADAQRRSCSEASLIPGVRSCTRESVARTAGSRSRKTRQVDQQVPSRRSFRWGIFRRS